jgi:hypothetical protein
MDGHAAFGRGLAEVQDLAVRQRHLDVDVVQKLGQ